MIACNSVVFVRAIEPCSHSISPRRSCRFTGPTLNPASFAPLKCRHLLITRPGADLFPESLPFTNSLRTDFGKVTSTGLSNQRFSLAGSVSGCPAQQLLRRTLRAPVPTLP